MKNRDHTWILGTIFCLVLCRTSSSITSVVHLSVDGSVTSESKLPECSVGGHIHLLSHDFEKASCSTDEICSMPLTPEAQILLHRMCSFRERCTNTTKRFPIGTDQIATRLTVHYRCLDHFSTYVDMCTNTTKKVDDTIQVLTTRTIEESEKCFCTLTGERFTILITDVRLMSPGKNHCSSVELEIGFNSYACNKTLKGSGSAFNKVVGERLSATNILVNNIPETFLPEKIWLTIQPEGSIRIKCNNIPRKVVATSTTQDFTSSSLTSDNKGEVSVYGPVGIGLLAVITVIVLVGCFICRRRSRASSAQAYKQKVKYSVVRPKKNSSNIGIDKGVGNHQEGMNAKLTAIDQYKATGGQLVSQFDIDIGNLDAIIT